MVGERNLGSGDVFRPGSARKGLTLPSNNTYPSPDIRAPLDPGIAIRGLGSLEVVSSSAVSDVHVNATDHGQRGRFHVKDDVQGTAGTRLRDFTFRVDPLWHVHEDAPAVEWKVGSSLPIFPDIISREPHRDVFRTNIIGGTSTQDRRYRPQAGTEPLMNSVVTQFHGSTICATWISFARR